MYPAAYFPADYFTPYYFPTITTPVEEAPGPVVGGRFTLIEAPSRPRVEAVNLTDDTEAIAAAIAILIA